MPLEKLRPFLNAAAQQARTLTLRIARTFGRSQPWQVAAVIITSTLIALTMWMTMQSVTRLQHRWEGTTGVLVTSTHVTAGEAISSTNSTFVRVPLALTPADALRAMPTNFSAAIALAANTPLTSSLVLPTGTLAEVPTGWRKVALPSDVPTPVLTPGMRVDVVSAAQTVASDALVVSVASKEMGAVVAVPANVAAQVAAAVRSGDASLVTQ